MSANGRTTYRLGAQYVLLDDAGRLLLCGSDGRVLLDDQVPLWVLLRLAGNAGQYVPRQRLYGQIAGGPSTDEALTKAVSRLRKQVGPSAIGSSAGFYWLNMSVDADMGSTPTQSPRGTRPADRPPALALTMEVAGHLIPGRHKPLPGHYASGRLYQFTLTNTSSDSTLIVSGLNVSVLATVADANPRLEATTADNHYEAVIRPSDVGSTVDLTPLDGAPRPSWNFHYGPHSAPDRFSVQIVPHEWGHSYAIQFVVHAYDPRERIGLLAASEVYAAFFPSGRGMPSPPMGEHPTEAFRRHQADRWAMELGQPVLRSAPRWVTSEKHR